MFSPHHVSHVMCRMSGVRCHVSFFCIFLLLSIVPSLCLSFSLSVYLLVCPYCLLVPLLSVWHSIRLHTKHVGLMWLIISIKNLIKKNFFPFLSFKSHLEWASYWRRKPKRKGIYSLTIRPERSMMLQMELMTSQDRLQLIYPKGVWFGFSDIKRIYANCLKINNCSYHY